MRRVLITGSRGFIGRNLAEACGNQFEFVGLDLAEGMDLRDPAALGRVDGPFHAVVHLAGLSFVPASHDRPYDYYSANFNTALAVAEFCRVRGVPLLIYPNTYVYGPPQWLPVDESHPIALPSPYHRSKHLAEGLLMGYFGPGQTRVVSLRVFNLYGPYQAEQFLVPQILRQACSGGSVTVRDLEPRRDFLHVNDFVRLIGAILDSTAPEAGVYNVGSGASCSVKEVIDLVSEILASELQVVNLNQRRTDEIMDCYADIRKARSAFNWAPAQSLRDGLSNLIGARTYV
jgi:nucleoside-diphosphate-sugar epimerase